MGRERRAMDRSVGSREPQAPLIEAEAEAEAGVKAEAEAEAVRLRLRLRAEAQGSTGLRAEG